MAFVLELRPKQGQHQPLYVSHGGPGITGKIEKAAQYSSLDDAIAIAISLERQIGSIDFIAVDTDAKESHNIAEIWNR